MESNQNVDPLSGIKITEGYLLCEMKPFHDFMDDSKSIKISKSQAYEQFVRSQRNGSLEEKNEVLEYFSDWPVQGVIVMSGIEGFRVGSMAYVRAFGGSLLRVKGTNYRLLNKNDVILSYDSEG